MPFDREPETVEESVGDFDLISTLRNNVSTGNQSVEAIFSTVASASRVMSGADGTALAVDTKGMMVCQARSGSIAPGVGTSMSRESGISGECLRTATMLVCHDTFCDPRVDAEVCEHLGIRSVVAVPLLEGTRAIGILEAFSAQPNAFDGDALSSLRALAEIAQIAHLRRQPALPAPPPMLPVPASRPTKYIPRAFTPEELSPQRGEKNRKLVWSVAAISVGLLLIFAVAWWAWHTPDETTGSTQTAHAAPAVETAAPKPLAIQVLPKPAPGVSGKHSSSRQDQDIVLKNAADVQPVDESTETATNAPASTPTRTTVKDSEATVVEAPSVSLAAPDNPEQLARLTSVQPQLPARGPVVSQGVVQPVLTHRVDASYPMQARTQRLSGKVTLLATIAADGSVRNLTVVNGSPILAAAAKNAVQQWHYKPATLNGTPIDVQKEITFLFEQP
jgi:TonB family protein